MKRLYSGRSDRSLDVVFWGQDRVLVLVSDLYTNIYIYRIFLTLAHRERMLKYRFIETLMRVHRKTLVELNNIVFKRYCNRTTFRSTT